MGRTLTVPDHGTDGRSAGRRIGNGGQGKTCPAQAGGLSMARAVVPAGDGEFILLVDSITEIRPEDSGRIVVSGSHGGVSAAGYAAVVPLAACFLNDAGIGKDGAGIGGVLSLPCPAAAYGPA